MNGFEKIMEQLLASYIKLFDKSIAILKMISILNGRMVLCNGNRVWYIESQRAQ